MKFILNSLNYSPELTGIGKYNGEMCPELVNRNVNVTAIVAPPYYPEWQVHNGYSPLLYKTHFVGGVKIIRCPLFVPKQISTLKRLIHLTTFAFSSGLALLGQLFRKPDVIFLVQPTFFCAPIALLVAKLTGAKAVMHIQDYEIDAMFGLGLMDEGKIASVAKVTESWFMKRFDAISTISYSMIENAVAKGVERDKIIYFPNWSDTEFVTPETDGSALKQEWGFTKNDKIILYAGNVGQKQGLEVVLAAAEHFKEETTYKFVIVGAGAHVDVLKAQADKNNLTNVYFLPLQPWEKVPEMLALADIHLVVQKKGAADAVLPSKLTNILSAGGHSLVTAEAETELGKLAEKHEGIFHCVEPENTDAFIAGLSHLLSVKPDGFNTVARTFANQYLAKDKILDNFLLDIKNLIKN